MPAMIPSIARVGLDIKPVQIEVDVASGLHSFRIVGLPDKSVEEAKERISSALKNSGFKPPRSFSKRVTVNLAPADIKKEGGVYDLPMALGFLLSSKQIENKRVEKILIVGELSLSGTIRGIRGALLYAIWASENNFSAIIVPEQNADESSLAKNITVYKAKNLSDIVAFFEKRKPLKIARYIEKIEQVKTSEDEDEFSMIVGQESAKRAIEIAASGGHHVLLQGPPGTGKTMLAKATRSILPRMSYEESVEATKIQSITRDLDAKDPLVKTRPFRSPHHSASESAILGGKSLAPGEISKAHRGVLFLDEFPELRRNVLEALRQPLEQGSISIARASGSVKYPARFLLIAAANPCPCGYLGDPEKMCSCSSGSIIRYRRKLSGPITDRIDIHILMNRQPFTVMSNNNPSQSSFVIKKRVEKARAIQENRFYNLSIHSNGEMNPRLIKQHCAINKQTEELLEKTVKKYGLSARAYHSILKVARTIADLSNNKNIEWEDIAEASQYARRERF